MEKIVMKCDKNWLLEGLDVWDWSNSKRYKNYMAVVTIDEKGDMAYDWLKWGEDSDEYFKIDKVNKGDIVVAGCKDSYKPRHSTKEFYKVIDKTDDQLTLSQAVTTYRKAVVIEN